MCPFLNIPQNRLTSSVLVPMLDSLMKNITDRYQQWLASVTQSHLQKSRPEVNSPSLEDWLQADHQMRKRHQLTLFIGLSVVLFLVVAGGFYWESEPKEKEPISTAVEVPVEAEAEAEVELPTTAQSAPATDEQLLQEVELLEKLVEEGRTQLSSPSKPIELPKNKPQAVKLGPVVQKPQKSPVTSKKSISPKSMSTKVDQDRAKARELKVAKMAEKRIEKRQLPKPPKPQEHPKQASPKAEKPAVDPVQPQRSAAKPVEKAVAQPEKPQPVATKPVSPVEQTIRSSDQYVQLGSFRNQQRANLVMNDLKESGFKIVMEQIEQQGKPLYLLRDYSAASRAQAMRLKKIYDGWFSLDSIIRF